MVNVGTVKEGSVGYYTQAEGVTAEEYYSVKGAEIGRWLGRGAEELGLTALVKTDDFDAIMHGRKPGDSDPLSPHFGVRKVLGIDTVFRAPKSVSLMYAIGNGEIAERVMIAHRKAVHRGLDYLEDRAFGGREGKAGARKVSGAGAITTEWNHVTSRAGDPLLHTHLVHANMIHSESGKWVTLDSSKIYAHAKTAGHIYQAELRRELSASLGVEWTDVAKGTGEVVGIDRGVIDHFSKRRAEIVEAVERSAADVSSSTSGLSAGAAQAAALETRRSKGSESNEDAFARWREEARQLGFGAGQVSAACGPPAAQKPARVDYDQLAQHLAGPDGMTKGRATFSRHLVIDEIANRLPATAGADHIERLADRWIEEYAIALEPKELVGAGNHKVGKAGEPALTTASMLDAEMRVLRNAADQQSSGAAWVPLPLVQGMLESPVGVQLNAGQREMVGTIARSGDGVDVVIGDAGTGKTTALGALRQLYTESGFRVVGAAMAHSAKEELSRGAGIESRTLRSLLGAIERGDYENAFPAGDRTLLVIDEASMISTREIARVLEAAAAVEAKVVLVGDPKQLPAIDAGGWFELLIESVGASRLTENLRQHDPVEREILAQMAAGEMSRAFDVAMSSERIVPCESEDRACAALAVEWMRSPYRDSSLILASTNREVDKLNDLCRRLVVGEASGMQTPPRDPGSQLLVGEPLIFRANLKELGVTNRERAVVVRDYPGEEHLVVRMRNDDRTVNVPREIASDPKKLAPGYASTVHVGQGTTVDACFMLAGGPMSREHIYVGFSRGRHLNKMFATEHAFESEAGFDLDLDPKTEQQLRASFERASAGLAASAAPARKFTKEERNQIAAMRRMFRTNPPTVLGPELATRAAPNESEADKHDCAVDLWVERHGGDVNAAYAGALAGRQNAAEIALDAAKASASRRLR